MNIHRNTVTGLFIVIFILHYGDCFAQDLKWNEDLYPDTVSVNIGPLKNSISFLVGLDGDGNAAFDIDYHRMIKPFFGVGGGFFLYTQWGSVSSLPNGDLQSDPYIHWSSDSKERTGGVKVSVLLSPTIFKAKNWKFKFDFKPACLVSIPYISHSIKLTDVRTDETSYTNIYNTGNNWVSFDVQLGFGFEKKQHCFKIAYSCSNCDLFSASRDIVYEGTSFNDFFPDKHLLVHRFFIGFIYSF